MVLNRTDIAEALSSVTGVQGFSYRPTTFDTGDAWPLLERKDKGPAQTYQNTWRVVVVLPTGEQDSMIWFDDMFQEIADALEDASGYVESIEPGVLDLEYNNTRNIMILTYREEA